jgi:hypothetical protein
MTKAQEFEEQLNNGALAEPGAEAMDERDEQR